jgi:hypothetical protein
MARDQLHERARTTGDNTSCPETGQSRPIHPHSSRTSSLPSPICVAALIRVGVQVHAFNQWSVAEILDMIRMLGAMVGACGRAEALGGPARSQSRPHP